MGRSIARRHEFSVRAREVAAPRFPGEGSRSKRIRTVKLAAYRTGPSVVLEIHDDGAGINLDAVRERAIARRLIDADAKQRGCASRFAVDDVIGQHQTVIKRLSNVYGDARGLSGATILGDGTVALIVDIPGVIRTLTAGAAGPA